MDEKSELFSLENTSKFLKKNLLLVILVLGGFLMLIVGGLQFFSKPSDSGIEFVAVESEVEANKIFVDISGAVNETGVYEFSQDDRISDAIKRAGGLAQDANTEYIDKNVNQAQKLSDGMKLYLPFEDERVSTVLGSSSESQSTSGLVNINSASKSQLESLPKIGPVTAEKIIAGRPYNGVEDLLIQKVVGNSVFEQIKDLVTAP
jgi:competence protein ComEA